MTQQEKERLRQLADRYLKNTISDDERAELEDWFRQQHDEPLDLPSDFAADEDELAQRIFNSVLSRARRPEESRTIRLWPRIAAAAAILLFLSAGGYFLLHKPKQQATNEMAANAGNDIAPGHNQATLTLANGNKIILTKGLSGKLAQQGQTQIEVSQDNVVYIAANKGEKQISYNTLTTARGEQSPYPLVLSDGTKVWLNAESSITFPTAFAGKERVVKVTGEAYFEVVHNDKQPFKVQTALQTIEDIGTQFDVNAYTDESTVKTTLLEGAVKVAGNGSPAVMLKPGEQAILSQNGVHVSKANLVKAVAWKNGETRFSDDDIKTVMRELARWYNIDVSYEGEVTKEVFYAKLSRQRNISAVLRVLERTKGIHFKVEGRRVTVIQ